MTLEQATERLRVLYNAAEKSEKIKQDSLIFALNMLIKEQIRQTKGVKKDG